MAIARIGQLSGDPVFHAAAQATAPYHVRLRLRHLSKFGKFAANHPFPDRKEGASHAPIKSGIRQPSPAKNAMMSAASSSGCSSAAKWPPFGMRVKRRMSVKVRAASERGGLRTSRGNSA